MGLFLPENTKSLLYPGSFNDRYGCQN